MYRNCIYLMHTIWWVWTYGHMLTLWSYYHSEGNKCIPYHERKNSDRYYVKKQGKLKKKKQSFIFSVFCVWVCTKVLLCFCFCFFFPLYLFHWLIEACWKVVFIKMVRLILVSWELVPWMISDASHGCVMVKWRHLCKVSVYLYENLCCSPNKDFYFTNQWEKCQWQTLAGPYLGLTNASQVRFSLIHRRWGKPFTPILTVLYYVSPLISEMCVVSS